MVIGFRISNLALLGLPNLGHAVKRTHDYQINFSLYLRLLIVSQMSERNTNYFC